MVTLSPDKLKLLKDHSFRSILFGIARMPRSHRAFIGSSDFKVAEIDLAAAKMEPKELYAHESYVTSVVVSGNQLISGGYDGQLIWWDIKNNKKVRSLLAHQRWIRKLALNPTGTMLATVADDMICRVWEVDSGKNVLELRGHEPLTPTHFQSMLFSVCWSADGHKIATADKVGHVVIWDVRTGTSQATIEAPLFYTWDPSQRRHSIGGIRSLAFSPNGAQLAIGGINRIGNIDHLDAKTRVEIFDLSTKKSLMEFNGEKFNGLVNHLQYAPSGDMLIGAGGAAEGCLLFFDLKTKKSLRQEKTSAHIHHFTINEEWDTIYCAAHNRLSIYNM